MGKKRRQQQEQQQKQVRMLPANTKDGERLLAPPTTRRASWRFHRCAKNGRFAWSDLLEEDRAKVHEKLAGYDSMAIAEWFDSTKDSHQVDVAKFSKEGRDALKAFAGESKIDSMASIRINGSQRVWAVREGDVFAIVWWDPEHEVCEAKLKHT